MAEGNVQTLERVYAEWAGGHFWAMDLFHEDIRSRWATEVPDLEGSQGIDGLMQLLQEWLQAWESCRIEAEQYFEAGDKVVVFVRLVGRGSGSSAEVTMQNAHVWTMSDGRATAIRAYSDRERALREVGVQG